MITLIESFVGEKCKRLFCNGDIFINWDGERECFLCNRVEDSTPEWVKEEATRRVKNIRGGSYG